MGTTSYRWRQLNTEQRAELLRWRKASEHPWHSPPHRVGSDLRCYHVTAACYEHAHHLGHSFQRMDDFASALLATVAQAAGPTTAWCMLPNHYHLLVSTTDLPQLTRALGRLHGRSAFAWNAEEDARGRTVFCRSADRAMRSEAHMWATINYIHHNPVHHGYTGDWLEWPWSSARAYVAQVGMDHAEATWREYPVLDYGRGWDDPAR